MFVCLYVLSFYFAVPDSFGNLYLALCTLQTNLRLCLAIMPECIVLLHCPPVSIMIVNSFRIPEFDYLPIHHTSFLLLDLGHSKN